MKIILLTTEKDTMKDRLDGLMAIINKFDMPTSHKTEFNEDKNLLCFTDIWEINEPKPKPERYCGWEPPAYLDC